MMKATVPSKKKPHDPEKIPLFTLILLGIALLSLIIVIVARNSVAFADFFNRRISSVFRAILAAITDLLPFSFAELLLLLIPAFLILLIHYATKKKLKTWRSVFSYTVTLFSAVSVIFSLFVLTYGTGYYVPTIDQKLKMTTQKVSAEQLKNTAEWLTDEMEQLTAHVYFGSDGASVMPYSLSEMNDKLMDAYRKLNKKYDFLQEMDSNIKPVMSSVAMSYAHLTGVYTFFTGEANLNVDFPDYTLPYTAAHEFAHQRGISRENEANFVAFLVCSESDDLYIQYCGYINLYEYVMNALYSADREAYMEVRAKRPQGVASEMKAYSAFYEKYRNSTAGELNNTLNNAFLQANGTTEGTKSYGMVVDLAVAYYEALNSGTKN